MRPVCSINLALLMLLLALTPAGTASAQCGMGVPSAGNPNCVPPDVLQRQGIQQPHTQEPAPQTIVIRREWKDRWGAIAVDGDAGSLGFSTGHPSKESAEMAAVRECLDGRGTKCEAQYPFHNQCGAFILGKTGWIFYTAEDTDQAVEHGFAECEEKFGDCRVYRTACSHAELVEVSRSVR